MTRRTYIYLAIPLFVLLGSTALFDRAFGAECSMALHALLLVVAWGVVWMRLYAARCLRPEFSLLSILPFSIYLLTRYMGAAEVFQQTLIFQNIYGLSWLGFMWVAFVSMRTAPCDPRQESVRRDPVYLLLIPIILIYTFATFTTQFSELKNSAIHTTI